MPRKTAVLNPPAPVGTAPEAERLTPHAITKQEFGRRLLQLCRQKRWTQSDLARRSGLGRDAISTYVRGRSFPTIQNLDKLAEALSTTPEELLPNIMRDAIDNEATPAIEIRQAQGHPDKVWLRVNRAVTVEQAAKVFQILKD